MRASALELTDIDAGDRVLDVGCGTGFGTAGVLERTDEVVGVDQSPSQLGRAQRKLGATTAQFCLGDAERLPFPTETFDHVWSSGSIEYWPRPIQTLAELRRVCRPGGTVLVVGPNEPSSRIFRSLADRIMLFYDEEEADRMFREAGFADIEHHVMGPSYQPEIAVTTIARVPD